MCARGVNTADDCILAISSSASRHWCVITWSRCADLNSRVLSSSTTSPSSRTRRLPFLPPCIRLVVIPRHRPMLTQLHGRTRHLSFSPTRSLRAIFRSRNTALLRRPLVIVPSFLLAALYSSRRPAVFTPESLASVIGGAFVGTAMSSRGGGRGKGALNQVMEVTAPAKKGRHQAKKQRKVVHGGAVGSARDDNEEVVEEEEMMNEDDDLEEEEEQPLKRKPSASSGGGIRINEGGDGTPSARRGGGGVAGGHPDFIDIERDVPRCEIGGRVKEGATVHESAQRVQTPSKRLNTPSVDVAGSSQPVVQGGALRSPSVVPRSGAVTAVGRRGKFRT
ncbi:hypothetical protein CBR_g74011 [Chara braunii]|uniref:Uncharacterized protein n=1 Tax=Chara braunii TaxID=69332 RepID=A0A388JJ62_CHABU|nr:hypothetical protein CBR_g74011 [Chara braunii]|eukprot:GBG41144.1 hypothetical protein CBR_g74011 [Chara braunii]